jgi:hypothetical protein
MRRRHPLVARGWAPTLLCAAEELATKLAASLRAVTRRFDLRTLTPRLGVLESFTVSLNLGVVTLGVDIDPAAGFADTGRLSTDLTDLFVVLGETVRELGIGALILIDELQEARPTRWRRSAPPSIRSVRPRRWCPYSLSAWGCRRGRAGRHRNRARGGGCWSCQSRWDRATPGTEGLA